MPDTRHRLRVPAELDRLAEVRALARDVATEIGAPEVCIDDVVQAVDEAATNIIVHGYAGHAGWLDVSVERDGDTIAVTLQDEAPPFDPTAVPEPDMTIDPDHRKPGGMGIHLIRLAVDTFAHRPRPGGGNILTMARTLDPRPMEER
ncbi:MAG: ATP-binding protein [Candidatus Limnocylindrales bacterium]